MKLVVLILPFIFLACSSPEEHEASMNFDLENVGPFVAELNTSLGFELDVAEVTAFAKSINVDEESSIELSVQYSGGSSPVRLTIFMDDYDAPDLYFFAENEALINAIQSEMIAFAESRGL